MNTVGDACLLSPSRRIKRDTLLVVRVVATEKGPLPEISSRVGPRSYIFMIVIFWCNVVDPSVATNFEFEI